MGWSAIALALSISHLAAAGVATRRPEPVFVYGSLSGQPTFDRDEQGGNPFATAFIQLLSQRSALFANFASDLVALTHNATNGMQKAEIVGGQDLAMWQFLPRPKEQTSVALVVVFSTYTHSGVGPSLPGAKRDLTRVAEALSQAGFAVTAVADPDRETLSRTLKKFESITTRADVALIYTTGHGIEINGVPRILLPYTRADGHKELTVSELAAVVRARRANLIFYAACRNRR